MHRYTKTNMQTDRQTDIRTQTCINTHTQTHTHTLTYIHTCTPTHTHTHTPARSQTHTHTHTHTPHTLSQTQWTLVTELALRQDRGVAEGGMKNGTCPVFLLLPSPPLPPPAPLSSHP